MLFVSYGGMRKEGNKAQNEMNKTEINIVNI